MTHDLCSERAFHWKEKIDYKLLTDVQEACQAAMDMGGYNLIRTATEKNNKSFEMLAKEDFEVWNYEFSK